MDWKLDTYFDAFASESYRKFKRALIDDLAGIYDDLNHAVSEPGADEYGRLLSRFEDVATRVSHLSSYLGCLVSAESDNDAYLAEEAALAEVEASMSKVRSQLQQVTGRLSDEVLRELTSSAAFADCAFVIGEMKAEARHRMAPSEEALASDLAKDGISAWSRMYFNTVSVMKFRYTDPSGEVRERPFSQYRALLSEPDRALRKAVFDGAKATFEEHRIPFASALNAIAGTRYTLNTRRGIGHFLEPSLRNARISLATLEAMMTAIERQLPAAREVFRARCRTMGAQTGAYYDLYAPAVPQSGPGPDWHRACETVQGAFDAAYPALGAFFRETLEKSWFDYRPREAKRPGGFCTTSKLIGESRIFMTYQDNLSDMMTLAHEVGHAWHSRLLKDTRPLNSSYPMTLAETASTFAEKILAEGVVQSEAFSEAEKAAVADAENAHLLAFLLDIPVRYRFESAFYERRAAGVVSPKTLCELMVQAQREVFADSLAEDGSDPWFWVSKLHFYIDDTEFYNYPYTFGFLLSRILHQRLKTEGPAFIGAYEAFLRESGSASCESVIRNCLGADCTDPDFWMLLHPDPRSKA